MSLLHLPQNPRVYGQDRKRGVCISFRIADFVPMDNGIRFVMKML